jgi:hypothetical protein
MTTQLSLPQNGLRVGNQIVADGDSVALGHDVGVENNLRVGNTVYANRVATPFVTAKHKILNAPLVIDCNYTKHNITLCASPRGITFNNVPPTTDGNFVVTVYLNQDSVGGRVMTWPTNITWPNTGQTANAPILPILQTYSYKVDVFEFVTFDGGSNWYAYQLNPLVTSPDVSAIQYALMNSQLSNFSGSIVQVKQVLSTAQLNFGSGGVYLDVMTMQFRPKYKASRLMISAELKHGTGTSSYSSDFMFTLGTTPLPNYGSGGAISNANEAQAVHFGGYQQATDTNHVEFKQGTIFYDHGADPGTILDLRLRGRHADAWAAQGIILNRSWGAPNGQYTAYNCSSFTIMEYLP